MTPLETWDAGRAEDQELTTVLAQQRQAKLAQAIAAMRAQAMANTPDQSLPPVPELGGSPDRLNPQFSSMGPEAFGRAEPMPAPPVPSMEPGGLPEDVIAGLLDRGFQSNNFVKPHGPSVGVPMGQGKDYYKPESMGHRPGTPSPLDLKKKEVFKDEASIKKQGDAYAADRKAKSDKRGDLVAQRGMAKAGARDRRMGVSEREGALAAFKQGGPNAQQFGAMLNPQAASVLAQGANAQAANALKEREMKMKESMAGPAAIGAMFPNGVPDAFKNHPAIARILNGFLGAGGAPNVDPVFGNLPPPEAQVSLDTAGTTADQVFDNTPVEFIERDVPAFRAYIDKKFGDGSFDRIVGEATIWNTKRREKVNRIGPTAGYSEPSMSHFGGGGLPAPPPNMNAVPFGPMGRF